MVTLLGHLPCLTHKYILRKPSEYSEIIVEPLFRNFINLVVFVEILIMFCHFTIAYAPCILWTCSRRHFSLLMINIWQRLHRTVLDSFLILGFLTSLGALCDLDIDGDDDVLVLITLYPGFADVDIVSDFKRLLSLIWLTGILYSAYRELESKWKYIF